MNLDFSPETNTEERIINSELFKHAILWGVARPGHPEGNLGTHIKHILDYINKSDQTEYRKDLRLLALLHDIGKPYTEGTHNSHAILSAKLAQIYTSDSTIIHTIELSDKYYGLYKNSLRQKNMNDEKIKSIYAGADLQLLLRFNYADSADRPKTAINWFEDKLFELGLTTKKLYKID